MILSKITLDFSNVCIPRESGDDPRTLSCTVAIILYSPRERG